MKKLITILFATVLTFSLSAQTDAGNFLLFGKTGLDFTSQKLTDTDPSAAWDDDADVTVNVMEFEALGGYFVTDGLALGLAISYDSESTEMTQDDYFYSPYGYGGSIETKESESTLIIGPVLRYYIASSGVWGQVAYGFGSNKVEEEYDYDYPNGYSNSDSDEQTNKVSVLRFDIGYAIYISDNLSINPTIGYGMTTVTIEDGYQTSNYNPYTGNMVYDTEDLKIKTGGLAFGIGLALHLD